MRVLLVLVVLLASFACGAPLTIGDVVTGRTCDVRAVQPHAIALVRQMLCEGVALASLQDVAGLELLPDSSTALVLPFLQPAARTALAAAVEGAAVPLRVMQALNTPVDAYVLWRWTLAGKCGLADSGRTFPMRPKDADDFGAGTVVQVEQPDQWEARLAAHHWFRQAGSDRFQFRAPIGQLVDVHYRQVLSWQRWFSGHNAQLGVAATGVFDATTQERMDASPAAGYPPSACRSSTPVSASARAITDPTAPPQSTSNTGDAQGALALVIAVPVGVASAFLGVLLVVELLSSFSGPRLPMTSKKRGHSDPNWLSQVEPADVEPLEPTLEGLAALDAPWDDEDEDPEAWSQVEEDIDTDELEAEMERMRQGVDRSDEAELLNRRRTMAGYQDSDDDLDDSEAHVTVKMGPSQ